MLLLVVRWLFKKVLTIIYYSVYCDHYNHYNIVNTFQYDHYDYGDVNS